MTQYIIVETATSRVLGFVDQDDTPELVGDHTVIENPQPVPCYPEPPSSTAVLEWRDGLTWTERASLDEIVTRAINQIDGQAETARLDVISRQTNTLEYQIAEPEARSFKAAGYPDDGVPPCVASWVKAKWRDAMTPQQAADDIIATADRWYPLLYAIRELRLCAKEDVRHASSIDEVSARVQQFTTELANLMAGAL